MQAGLPPPGARGRGEEGARGREKGGEGGPDSPSAVPCRADPGLLRRRSVPSCRPARPSPGTPAQAWSTRPPSSPGAAGGARVEKAGRRPRTKLPPRAPAGREASLSRVRGWPMAWMPGTLGASIREPSRSRRSHRPPTSTTTPPPRSRVPACGGRSQFGLCAAPGLEAAALGVKLSGVCVPSWGKGKKWSQTFPPGSG